VRFVDAVTGPPATGLLDVLQDVVGPRHLLTDPELTAAYERDVTGRYGARAAAVVRPADTAQVAAVLAACTAAGVAVVPQGGNTGLVGGGVPRGGEVVLSLTRLTEIGPVDRTAAQVTAGAGVTPVALERALAGTGLALGVDFGARGSATLGGMVATDAGGAQVVRHGTMRARVAGLEAVLPDGRVLRRLSGLVKDNAGYDLPQLLVGSEGTLAVITAVRLALVPAPARTATALLALGSLDDAVGLVARLRGRLPGLLAADVMFAGGVELVCAHRRLPPPFAASHPVLVVVDCEGEGDPVEALAAALEDEPAVLDVAVADDTARREALWTYREAHNEAVNAAGVPHKLDVSLPQHALAPFAAAVPEAVARHVPGARIVLWGHLGDGNLHVNVLGADPEDERVDDAVLELVAAHGGSISAEHGVGVAKRDRLHLTRSPEELEVMASLKRALDPAGTLNPGVVLPVHPIPTDPKEPA
jgi:FAD/FMN-containing dehydrogenase